MTQASTILSVKLYSNEEQVTMLNMKLPFQLHFKLKRTM